MKDKVVTIRRSNNKKRGLTAAKIPFPGYLDFFRELKARVSLARVQVARSVNSELLLLYWDIGQRIVDKQRARGWGDAVVERVAADLRAEFDEVGGFSPRNVWDMRRLYLAYSGADFLSEFGRSPPAQKKILRQPVAESASARHLPSKSRKIGVQFVRQLVAQVPWGQHLLLLNKLTDPAARLYYLHAVASFGWSRNVLLNQIKAGTFERARKEKKANNFAVALPEHFAEQADEVLKSRYNLDFLGISKLTKERALEDRLLAQLQRFILELGYGFCFVGRQHRLTLGAKEYFVDLLFYHRFLKALVAFELKIGSFAPEHAGKMDFYLNLLNEMERGPGDQPSIGIILCAEKHDIEVEFALKSKTNPIGVSEYQLQSNLPAGLKGKLPTVKQLTEITRALLPQRK